MLIDYLNISIRYFIKKYGHLQMLPKFGKLYVMTSKISNSFCDHQLKKIQLVWGNPTNKKVPPIDVVEKLFYWLWCKKHYSLLKYSIQLYKQHLVETNSATSAELTYQKFKIRNHRTHKTGSDDDKKFSEPWSRF